MRLARRRFLGLAASFCAAPRASAAQSWEKDLQDFIADGLAATHTPGLSVAIVRGGKTVFARGYGYADVARARRVTADTAFHIASVSKTVTGAAMMLLWQDGAFRLDDPIAPHVDFPVAHPKFPDAPITFRQLFTHTSGISDTLYDVHDFSGVGDPALPLRDFLSGYLSPKGQWYDADKCYSAAKPGTEWSYSNVAVALLGYLAGRVGSDGLEELTHKRLFAPLGMRDTAWKAAQLQGKDVALPYDFDGTRYKALPLTGYPDWPAGLLRTSANDFAKFLSIFTAPRAPYLRLETLKTILTPDPVAPKKGDDTVRQGLSWLLVDHGGAHLAAHRGGDPGADTIAAFDFARRTAALVFANISPGKEFKPFQDALIQRLLARGTNPR
jgi:CubicO group peptidase (beta-lactamase class C family)